MGSTYSNVTLLGVSVADVRAVSPRPAFYLSDGDAVVVFAAADEEGQFSGEALSQALGCIAFTASVFDDDVLFMQVHDHGRSVVDGAVPDPAVIFGIDADLLAELEPSMLKGDAVPASPVGPGVPEPASLVGAVGRGDADAVRAALDDDYVFASERHAALVAALRLPSGAVGWGYRYLSRDDTGDRGPAVTKL